MQEEQTQKKVQQEGGLSQDRPPIDYGEVVHDVVWFIVSVALAFGWLLLMLLIVSFLTLSYLHFELKWMIIVSLIFAVIVAVLHLRSLARKWRR